MDPADDTIDARALGGVGSGPFTIDTASDRTDLPVLDGLSRIGRHVVLERIGEGGMGVVVSAYDPELDRKLAIKLIRVEHGGERAEQRMLREAQALAKLSHPNVIAIYDVGTIPARDGAGSQLYIAMELVAGRTLTRWLAERRDRPLDWRALLGLYVQAGRGLAAAHDAGLVHRDFKPDNVLVGDDGRVRVVDFGLARAAERTAAIDEAPAERDPSVASAGEPLRSSSARLLDQQVTAIGALLGTPAYLPPERLRGRGDDARGDQHAFGVALWEGLYGARPYTGSTMLELFGALLEGRRVDPPRERRAAVPDWLHQALERALEREPDRRFASMHALLAALEPPAAHPRSRWLGVLGLGSLAALAVALAAVRPGADEGPAPCTGFEQRLVGVWDDERRAAVRSALEASDRSYAAASSDLVDRELDAWTDRWSRLRTEACLATAVRSEQSAELLDLRMTCFDRRLSELDSLVDVLAGGGRELVDEVPRIVAALPELERCSDAEQLLRAPPRPSEPERAAAIDELERALDEVEAQWQAGRYAPGLERAEALRERVVAVDWAPLHARHARLLGALLGGNQRTREALATTTEALALARRLDDDRLAVRTTIELVQAGSGEPSLGPELERLAQVALAELTRLDEPLLEARLQLALGTSRFERGDPAGAQQALQRALALRESVLGPRAWEVAMVRQELADILWPQGEVERAKAIYLEAQATYAEQLGPDHPRLSDIDGDLGAVAWVAGDYEEALRCYRRQLARCERSMPAINCMGSLGNVGATLGMQGKLDEARGYFERAVELLQESPDHHAELTLALENLAELEQRSGNLPRARALLGQSRAIRRTTIGEQHPDYARVVLAIAELDLTEDRPELARTGLEQALALRQGVDVHVILRARIHRALARAHAALGEPWATVVEHLDAARADYLASKIAQDDELAALEALRAELEQTRGSEAAARGGAPR